MYKPMCDECLRANGVEPNNCPFCLRGFAPTVAGLHHNNADGYMGRCSAGDSMIDKGTDTL